MLDHKELCKYFTKDQMQDMIDLKKTCDERPPGRIRRSRIRKVKPNHIPRPVNSFMTYRTEQQSIVRKFCPTANHREISKMVAKWWHNISTSERASYIDQAKAAKVAHYEKYPDYIFRPKAKRVSSKASTIETKNTTSPASVAVKLEKDIEEPTLTNATPQNLAVNDLPNYSSYIINSQQQGTSNDYYSNNYSFDVFGNNMYCDDVLFDTAHEEGLYQSSYWNSIPQPIAQPASNLLYINPNQVHQQAFCENLLSYYASPVTKPLLSNAADQLDSFTPVNQYVCNPPILSSNAYAQQLYATPPLDNEITPQSQTMSTPRLSYPSTPYIVTESPTSIKNGNGFPVDFDQNPSSLFGNCIQSANMQHLSPVPIDNSNINSNFDHTVLGDYNTSWSNSLC